MFLEKGVLKRYSEFTGEYPCQSVISIKLHFGMGVVLQICCIFWGHLFLRIPLEGCFWELFSWFYWSQTSYEKSHVSNFFSISLNYRTCAKTLGFAQGSV